MKKLSLLVLTAIVGTSSVALAEHAPAPAPGVIQRDHRFDADDYADLDARYTDRLDRRFRGNAGYEYRDGRWMRRPALTWEHLGTVRGAKAVLNLGREPGRFKSIKLDVHGQVRINRVVIHFADGTRQVLAMRRQVNGRMASPVIDLGTPRKIRSMIVYSSPWSRGSVTVTGLKVQRVARRF